MSIRLLAGTFTPDSRHYHITSSGRLSFIDPPPIGFSWILPAGIFCSGLIQYHRKPAGTINQRPDLKIDFHP
ncbi:MAG: hypothetical protein A2Z16_15120 [Chloroflexi bacterium RBG_16_54_18]|nr:MAG: hypothetical protein A2Z16_15120 [Chloroflexi bacterium RBG_16_54_18]